MARPRLHSDADLLAATARAVGRVGPGRLTLADVAAEAGVAPATLVQRFGGKRGLLLAFSASAPEGLARTFEAGRAEGRAPLDTLERVLVGLARDVATPESLANHLALLHVGLTDPEFHRHALRFARTLGAQVRRLLDEAAAAGDLLPTATGPLARAVEVAYNGALVTWAVHRDGALVARISEALSALLALRRPPGRGARRGPR